MESVILETPILLCGFVVAMALNLFAVIKKVGLPLSLLSIALFIATASYALIIGATLYEVGVFTVLFFIVNLLAWLRG